MRYGELHTKTQECFIKIPKTEEGSKKLEMEKDFYRNVQCLNVPKVLYWNPFVIEKIDGRNACADDYMIIMSELKFMHCLTEEYGVFEDEARLELSAKLINRNLKKPEVVVDRVNGLEIPTMKQAIDFMSTVKIKVNRVSVIHGDPHFGNVLIDKNGEAWFIDPRGHFGNMKLKGVPEYDYAKVHLSLCGYNELEQLSEPLKLISGNLIIPITLHEKALDVDYLTGLFLCSIWLGNAHGFTSDEIKYTSSYYYSLYIFKMFCLKFNIDI